MRRGLILLGSCAALALPAMVMAQTPPTTVPPPVASKVMAPAGWAEFRQGQADAARGDSKATLAPSGGIAFFAAFARALGVGAAA